MARKIGRGEAPIVLLGLLRYLERRSPGTVWFRLNIKGWSKSNGRCYQTGLKAIQDLATASGDFDPPKGRKRAPTPLPPAVERGAKAFKFRCLQVMGKGRNASFVWHVAPRERLLWDKEPLFYRHDRKTERHVRRQLRSVDIEIARDGTVIFWDAPAWLQMELGLEIERVEIFEQLELGLKIIETAAPGQSAFNFGDINRGMLWPVRVMESPANNRTTAPKSDQFKPRIFSSKRPDKDLIDNAGHYRIDDASIYKKEISLQQFSNTTPAPPDCSQRGLSNLRRKAHVLLSEVESIHECSTGKVPFSKGHAVSFLLKGLQEGYAEKRLLRSYRRAHEFATAYVCDGLARTPLAVLLWRAKWELKRTDNLTRSQRVQAFYEKRKKDAVEMQNNRLTTPQSGQAPAPQNTGPSYPCNRNGQLPTVPPSSQAFLHQSAAGGGLVARR